MAFEKLFSKYLTRLARIFGVVCLLVAIVALISAAADIGNRALFIVLGVGLLIAGVAFMRVKPVTPADVGRVRTLIK
jgi:apolipoprotein N-acyltransferase